MKTKGLAHYIKFKLSRLLKSLVYALRNAFAIFCIVYGLFSFFIGDHYAPCFPHSLFWTVEAICSVLAICFYFYYALKNKYIDQYMQLCNIMYGRTFYAFRNDAHLPAGALVRIDKYINNYAFPYAIAKVESIDSSDPSRMVLVLYAKYDEDHYQRTNNRSLIPPNEYKYYKLINDQLTVSDLENLYCDRRSDNA